jgi:CheY-like chemotaxis protein
MVYGFVKQSGGHVRLAPGEGGGTDVEIHLPRWHGAGTLAEEPAGDGAAPRAAAGEVVLVVEDEAEVRRTSVAMLEELGYRVIEAADAARGLDQLRARPDVALLFTDVVMPGMDGRRLAELARALRPDLRVLHTTGFARAGERREDALPPGAAVLPKPFTLEALAQRVREAIEAPRADLPPDRGAAAAAAPRGG